MIFKPNQTALFISPHTDDAELCCGGTINKLVRGGVRVLIHNCGFATGAYTYEPHRAAEVLGASSFGSQFPVREYHTMRQEILESFRKLNTMYIPDFVFTTCHKDTHQDHQTVAAEVFRAFKHGTIISWETPWNNLDFSPNFYCEISDEDLEKKLEAIRQYETQSHRYYFDEDYIRGWSRMRGGQVNKRHAEAYKIVRMMT